LSDSVARAVVRQPLVRSVLKCEHFSNLEIRCRETALSCDVVRIGGN
jgi:hypothetical protein